MDVLSDILRAVDVRGSVYFCDTLTAPWTLEFERPRAASFHVVRRGTMRLTSGEHREDLESGDLVFLEAGRDHSLSSVPAGQPSTEPTSETLLLCGYFDVGPARGTPLDGAFPSLRVVRAGELREHAWLSAALEQLLREYRSQAPGADVIVDRLTEIVLIELIRIDFGRADNRRFVGALADRKIAEALNQLHSNPHVHWTIESMAANVAMSRAAFARRFRELVGTPMFAYLTNLRMRRAQSLLRRTALPVSDIAQQVGYDSDPAFVRTFRRYAGTTPARYRKTRHERSNGGHRA